MDNIFIVIENCDCNDIYTSTYGINMDEECKLYFSQQQSQIQYQSDYLTTNLYFRDLHI